MHRRAFLKFIAAATTVAAASPIISACSSSSDSEGAPESKANGAALDTLRIAAIGSPGENLNISEAVSTAT